MCTGRAWAGCSTEGVVIYSLDDTLIFDPFMLEEDITPESIRRELLKCEYGKALLMALKLNESPLIVQAFEETPIAESQWKLRELISKELRSDGAKYLIL